MSVLVWQFARTNLDVQERKRVFERSGIIPSEYLAYPNFGDQLFLELQNIPKLKTHPYVIAELMGLAVSRAGFKGEALEAFRTMTITYLEENLTEVPLILHAVLHSSELSNIKDIAAKIGFTDTAVLELGKQLQLPILTYDRKTLVTNADQFNIHCLDCHTLLSKSR